MLESSHRPYKITGSAPFISGLSAPQLSDITSPTTTSDRSLKLSNARPWKGSLPHWILTPELRGRAYSPNLINKEDKQRSDLVKSTRPAGGEVSPVYEQDPTSQTIT